MSDETKVPIKSHELAKWLLEQPDMPVLHTNGWGETVALTKDRILLETVSFDGDEFYSYMDGMDNDDGVPCTDVKAVCL